VYFREECFRRLDCMKINDCDSCPIDLREEEGLQYNDVADYMNTKTKIETVETKLLNSMVRGQARAEGGRSRRGQRERRREDEDQTADQPLQQQKVIVRQSKSAYTSVQSAVSFLYRSSGVQRGAAMKTRVATYISGVTRRGMQQKQSLGLKIVEGKKPMKKECYSKLAELFFKSDDRECIFAHLFLILDWNLMKRAENCVDAKVNHITFENDCLIFEFAKSKSHQSGEDHVGPWHVYSNPLEPHICPVLSLARYLFTYPDVMKTNSPLFDGDFQYNRYSKIFNRTLDENWDIFKGLGLEKGDLGTHSSRKGVASMVSGGCTVCPPIVSLCIRVGWVMGGVKDRYLKHESAGDQYVGQSATGKDPLLSTFAASPPYFDFSHIQMEEERMERDRRINLFLKDRMPEDTSPATVSIAKMCLASIFFTMTTCL